ncbi:hypothetical protein [Candidatus Mycobacterium methanotrophicum]|uniref:Uncharacterized protein n=1 Tax=Candidatus Mycobacterium methanotrophicum TaxID=2943498 RepID=A0ABY4QTZ3_9MYCO|nr:hypothetical protein [Candidatus Mycobacterium methanotrophicum]UQX13449.1 hypothetical protein M5I08_24905 [Candidatus Mycobacterium methanotrophicum]
MSDLTRSVAQWSADVLLYGAAGMGVWITAAVVRRRVPVDGGGTEYGASAQPRTRHVWAAPGWWLPVAVRLTVLAAVAAMTGIACDIEADPDFDKYEHVCACISRAW